MIRYNKKNNCKNFKFLNVAITITITNKHLLHFNIDLHAVKVSVKFFSQNRKTSFSFLFISIKLSASKKFFDFFNSSMKILLAFFRLGESLWTEVYVSTYFRQFHEFLSFWRQQNSWLETLEVPEINDNYCSLLAKTSFIETSKRLTEDLINEMGTKVETVKKNREMKGAESRERRKCFHLH